LSFGGRVVGVGRRWHNTGAELGPDRVRSCALAQRPTRFFTNDHKVLDALSRVDSASCPFAFPQARPRLTSSLLLKTQVSSSFVTISSEINDDGTAQGAGIFA
jgi:hypothetical protein